MKVAPVFNTESITTTSKYIRIARAPLFCAILLCVKQKPQFHADNLHFFKYAPYTKINFSFIFVYFSCSVRAMIIFIFILELYGQLYVHSELMLKTLTGQLWIIHFSSFVIRRQKFSIFILEFYCWLYVHSELILKTLLGLLWNINSLTFVIRHQQFRIFIL